MGMELSEGREMSVNSQANTESKGLSDHNPTSKDQPNLLMVTFIRSK